jgi:hypothetical protein
MVKLKTLRPGSLPPSATKATSHSMRPPTVCSHAAGYAVRSRRQTPTHTRSKRGVKPSSGDRLRAPPMTASDSSHSLVHAASGPSDSLPAWPLPSDRRCSCSEPSLRRTWDGGGS